MIRPGSSCFPAYLSKILLFELDFASSPGVSTLWESKISSQRRQMHANENNNDQSFMYGPQYNYLAIRGH